MEKRDMVFEKIKENNDPLPHYLLGYFQNLLLGAKLSFL